MPEHNMSYSEYRDVMIHRTQYSQDQIYQIWKAVFQRTSPVIEPTSQRVEVVASVCESNPYESVIDILTK